MAGQNMNIAMKNIGGRVGSYAISTIDFSSWMNEPTVQSGTKTRKNRGVKEIVHKIFSECASSIDDPFWVEKFNNLAIGKFPRGFSYHDGQLSYKKGAKCYTVDIYTGTDRYSQMGNNYIIAQTCMEFFRVNGGIFSPMDEQRSVDLQYARTKAVEFQEPLTWADASKKMQECMLSHYVRDMKDIMNLTEPEMEQLRQILRMGISNKFFGKNNIKVENNRIQSIEGLLWKDSERSFYINPDLKPNVSRNYSRNKEGSLVPDPSQKDLTPQWSIRWNKYVESLEKKMQRFQRIQGRHHEQITINHPGATIKRSILNILPSTTGITESTTNITTDDLSDPPSDDDYDDASTM